MALKPYRRDPDKDNPSTVEWIDNGRYDGRRIREMKDKGTSRQRRLAKQKEKDQCGK